MIVGGFVLIVVSIAFFFPNITNSIITGFASIAGFGVSLSVTHARFNITNRTQIDMVIVDGSNITLRMYMHYYDNITMNLTLDKPADFECGFDWYVNESGTIKNITVNGNTLSWEADKSIKDTFLFFEVPPPSIPSEVEYTGDSFYEKTLTISSCCPLSDVTANISVNSAYAFYTLYLIENNTLTNKTTEYNLQVSNDRAIFSGFNLSNKTFRLIANPDAAQVVAVVTVGSSSGGGGGGAVPLLNYTPTQKFIVEPNYMSIITSSLGPIETEIIIYNFRGGDKEFSISYTNNFIYDIQSTVMVPAKEFLTVPVHIDTSLLTPGKYTDFIGVSHEGIEEEVTVALQILKSPETEGISDSGEEAGSISAEEQQPGIISENQKKKEVKKNANTWGIILAVLGGLLLMGGVVFFHLRSKTRVIKY